MSEKRVSDRAKKQTKLFSAYQKVFSSPDGELVLNDLMKSHSISVSTFGKDIHEMLFKEGERHVVIRILKILKIDIKNLKERIESYENEVE